MRSLKYEDVYLKGYADGREAARGIAGRGRWMDNVFIERLWRRLPASSLGLTGLGFDQHLIVDQGLVDA